MIFYHYLYSCTTSHDPLSFSDTGSVLDWRDQERTQDEKPCTYTEELKLNVLELHDISYSHMARRNHER